VARRAKLINATQGTTRCEAKQRNPWFAFVSNPHSTPSASPAGHFVTFLQQDGGIRADRNCVDVAAAYTAQQVRANLRDRGHRNHDCRAGYERADMVMNTNGEATARVRKPATRLAVVPESA